MRTMLEAIAVLILIASLLISCRDQVIPQQDTHLTGGISQLQPAVVVPSECHPTRVYRSSDTDKASLAGIPWAKAEPASSRIVAHLFFAGPSSSENRTYQPLHMGGRSPNGTSMKILWSIDNPQASKTIEITGKELLVPQKKTFSQVFPVANTPANTYPSILDVPTAGCWQLTLKSGMVTGTLIFWVTGN